jgi:hypothetical protein
LKKFKEPAGLLEKLAVQGRFFDNDFLVMGENWFFDCLRTTNEGTIDSTLTTQFFLWKKRRLPSNPHSK